MQNKIFNNIKFLGSANTFEQLINNDLPEIAFWGRSNVGKSSTINAILNHNIAHVSQNPGRTRQINLFMLGNQQAMIVDLPGYGYAKLSKKIADNLYQLCYDYLHKRRPILMFVLIDSRRGLMSIDNEVLQALSVLGHNTCIIFTKIDLIRNINEISKFSRLDFLMISNKSRIGILELRKKIIDILNEAKNYHRKS